MLHSDMVHILNPMNGEWNIDCLYIRVQLLEDGNGCAGNSKWEIYTGKLHKCIVNHCIMYNKHVWCQF